MSEPQKKQLFSEDDLYELLQRYNPSILISLLQEIYEFTNTQSDSEKIDWNALVRNTCTGISNAREYQMLWRHLAYKNSLIEKIEDGSEPLDDDSDLELELELVPASSAEELAEAKEAAKILLSSGPSRDSGSAARATIEPSSTEDSTNDHVPLDPFEKAANSSYALNHHVNPIPVSGQKHALSTGTSVEDLDGNGCSGLPTKKKRHLWTKEEDDELIAAVQKCGEGMWANILKGDFKHSRTASQLSQRWAILRKKQANSNSGNGSKAGNTTLSEERLAAQKAFSMAVNMPISSMSLKFSGSAQAISSATASAATSETANCSASQPLVQCQEKGALSTMNKLRPVIKKPATTQPMMGPNPLIQAAAFAAGGRIANPSTAASLFKAAQSKNVVHIRPGGAPLPIPMTKPAPGIKPIRPSSTFGTIHSVTKPAQPSSSLPLTRQTSLDPKQDVTVTDSDKVASEEAETEVKSKEDVIKNEPCVENKNVKEAEVTSVTQQSAKNAAVVSCDTPVT